MIFFPRGLIACIGDNQTQNQCPSPVKCRSLCGIPLMPLGYGGLMLRFYLQTNKQRQQTDLLATLGVSTKPNKLRYPTLPVSLSSLLHVRLIQRTSEPLLFRGQQTHNSALGAYLP